jgi:hypothetical protein
MPCPTKKSSATAVGGWAPTERQFMAAVVALAQWNDWRTFHPWLSMHSAGGWPDLTLLRNGRLICAELKRDGRAPTLLQRAWLDELAAVPGVECYCWHPADWEAIERVLVRERKRRAPERRGRGEGSLSA